MILLRLILNGTALRLSHYSINRSLKSTVEILVSSVLARTCQYKKDNNNNTCAIRCISSDKDSSAAQYNSPVMSLEQCWVTGLSAFWHGDIIFHNSQINNINIYHLYHKSVSRTTDNPSNVVWMNIIYINNQ